MGTEHQIVTGPFPCLPAAAVLIHESQQDMIDGIAVDDLITQKGIVDIYPGFRVACSS
jgi:hypothetical protein